MIADRRRNTKREREITMSETHGKFIWCELMTPDPSGAKAFYGKVVGWSNSEMTVPGQPPYTIFEADGVGRAGMMQFPAELEGTGIPPNWTGYVAVDDVDRSARDFAANGGSVRRPPQDIPEIGRFAVVADPHGAVICIMTPAPMENPPPEPPLRLPARSAGANSMPVTAARPSRSTKSCSAGPRTTISTWARWVSTGYSPSTARRWAAS
jgi:predicted enzyme related to lactoylglutathione lyase